MKRTVVLLFVATLLAACGSHTSGPTPVAQSGPCIAFLSDRDAELAGGESQLESYLFSLKPPYEIYVVNVDGSGLTRLTNNTAQDDYATWSPDGRRIAFDSNRDGEWEIYVMNADGTVLRRLTDNAADDHTPAWRP